MEVRFLHITQRKILIPRGLLITMYRVIPGGTTKKIYKINILKNILSKSKWNSKKVQITHKMSFNR